MDNCHSCESTYILCDECKEGYKLDPLLDESYGFCVSTNTCPKGQFLDSFFFNFCNLCFPTCDYCSLPL
jgi:hypothetical protein